MLCSIVWRFCVYGFLDVIVIFAIVWHEWLDVLNWVYQLWKCFCTEWLSLWIQSCEEFLSLWLNVKCLCVYGFWLFYQWCMWPSGWYVESMGVICWYNCYCWIECLSACGYLILLSIVDGLDMWCVWWLYWEIKSIETMWLEWVCRLESIELKNEWFKSELRVVQIKSKEM